ncbi:Mss4-like protein [Cordyceps fumosorosea ARSEF 2679]|uniref:Mss4-like protein n=1 Tax=Cordyceps fumosorosea (strain ARSEF 2679) TaxID=1081104 RepID=A0A167NJU4_CORFA|nr:Mss4-like protein [Cordyceps fumosorosea ARSEF 2679]OAA55626.1 Mss4-like protein [Cordyceps fumosorosea ARSEF 2679]
MTTELPTTVSGGCLCEGVRYTITFPPDHDFLRAASTCQCSQCRKQTGALIFRAHKVPRAGLVWTSRATLRTYRASANAERGFCGACGGMLFWAADGEDRVSVCVGSLDGEALSRYGRALTYAERHLYCVNEIEGVTDHLPGRRYQGDD